MNDDYMGMLNRESAKLSAMLQDAMNWPGLMVEAKRLGPMMPAEYQQLFNAPLPGTEYVPVVKVEGDQIERDQVDHLRSEPPDPAYRLELGADDTPPWVRGDYIRMGKALLRRMGK
jgi:hypothetical protein